VARLAFNPPHFSKTDGAAHKSADADLNACEWEVELLLCGATLNRSGMCYCCPPQHVLELVLLVPGGARAGHALTLHTALVQHH